MPAPVALVFRVAADVTAMRANLKDAVAQLETTKSAMKSMANSLDGSKLIADANAMVKVVSDLGGAAMLTASEQKRVNATVTEAIAKYEALGKEAPAALFAVQAQTSKVVATAEQLPAALQKIEPPLTLAQKAAGLLHSTFGQMFAAFSATSLISTATGALVSLGRAAIADAGSLVDLSNTTGLSTETLQRMQFAAKQSGSDMTVFADAAFKMGVTVSEGTGKARSAARDLGLQWDQLRAMSPDQQFAAVTAALEAMQDPQRRNVDGLALFGKTFKEIAPAIVDGYTKMASAATVSSDEQVRAVDRAGDAWDAFVDRQKKGITSWLGNMVLARETVDKLTAEQQARFLAIQKSGGDAQAYLLDIAAKIRKAVDVNLKVEAPKPIPESFVASLKAAEAGYRALSAEQRGNIEAALKLGESNDAIINNLNITDGVLTVAKKAFEDNKSAVSKAAEAAKQYAELLTRIFAASVPLTAIEKERVRTLEALKVSQSDIAKYLGVTEAAVSKYTDSLKETAKALADIGKEVLALRGVGFGNQQGVPLRPVTRDMSGSTPMIDIEAVRKASNAVKLISDTTWNDIEGRMKAAGLVTKLVLQKQAADAKEQYASMLASGKYTFDELVTAQQRAATAGTAAMGGWASSFTRVLATVPQTMISAFTGGGGISGAMKGIGSSLGSTIGTMAFGPTGFLKGIGDMIPGIGPAIGSMLGPALEFITKLFSSAGRDAVKTFANSFGGFPGLQAKLVSTLGDAVGGQFWVQLTQQVKRNDKAGADAVINAINAAFAASPSAIAAGAGYKTIADLQAIANQARKTYEYMRDSGLYTAAAVADAFTKSKDAQIAALGEEASAATAAMITARDNARAVVDGLDQQLKSLRDSIANEAPEEVMGIIEANTRAQIDAITAKRKDAQEALDKVNDQIQAAADAAVAAAQRAATGAGAATVDAIRTAIESE